MSDLSAVEQLPQPDPRGWLALRHLPADLQNAEDSTHAADHQRHRCGVFGFAVALWDTGAIAPDAELRRLRKLVDRLLQAADAGWRAFARPATPTERVLLGHLGYEATPDGDTAADDGLPVDLITIVSYPSPGVRSRRWPQLETH